MYLEERARGSRLLANETKPNAKAFLSSYIHAQKPNKTPSLSLSIVCATTAIHRFVFSSETGKTKTRRCCKMCVDRWGTDFLRFFFGVSFVLYLHFSVVNGQCFMLHLVLVVAFVSEFILSPTALWFSVNFVFDCAFFFLFLLSEANGRGMWKSAFFYFYLICGATTIFNLF